MRLMQNLRQWVAALVHWLVDAWRVGVPLLAILLVSVIAISLPLKLAEAVLRYCGLAFELLGILTIVSGLRDKRRLFDRPSLLQTIRAWLSRRPRWGARPGTILMAGTASVSLSAGIARLSVRRGASADASIEARLAAIEANLETLRTEQGQIARDLEEATRKANETVAAERRARESALTAIRVQLERLGAEGIHVEMMGVVWLVLGTVLATVPGEIASALRWRQ
jgi:hypothetical protein